ncbi:MAG: precorrin-6y C5,15-methyltransferase (decarboxylating) subunit CbiE [Actinomycetota bacterium]|nr:precorrin-6y C5,15-methyltransferase (decarboxylating) subunit CbiE [Actinomycetota bacterium]
MITVVGYDGTPLAPAAVAALRRARLVVGGERHLAAVPVPSGAETVVMGDVRPAVDALVAAGRDGADAVVVASGDPGFFGILRRLREAGLRTDVVPAVSSVAQVCARAGVEWDDAVVVSAHGRDPRPALSACRRHRKVVVLTDAVTGPAEVGAAVADTDRTLVVGVRLGEPEEAVARVSPGDAARREWPQPNVVLVLDADDTPQPPRWLVGAQPPPGPWALPDTEFAHRAGMVTKAEVRAVVLARLGPRTGDLVWDIGAGSGSVGIECARLGAAVVLVERDERALADARANLTRHGVPAQVVAGSAPPVLDGLPRPDAVFVGGGGLEVLQACADIVPDRLVSAFAAVDRVGPALGILAAAGYRPDAVQVQANRVVPLPDGGHRLAATNPVVVVWGEKP